MFCVPDLSEALASLKRGVRLTPDKGGGTRGALINIGVIDEARGRGVARAMAARSFLEMARQGMQYAGYTLVLDDNWPSRRCAESLGARVTEQLPHLSAQSILTLKSSSASLVAPFPNGC